MDIVVGTAGHIDHGKTALVKALTGTDTDRLPEEKKRGITIDLGFAEAEHNGIHVGFVDVPGHERFIKNMLAGASGIDVVMLVVAADEGVMPQTREHFDICRLLGVSAGVVAITKSDLADEEQLELARMEISDLVSGTFLDGLRTFPVSAKTGAGLAELKDALADAAAKVPPRSEQLVVRLPVDRSFVKKGFGTVITGTLASGELTEGSELDLFPSDLKVRARGIQTHGRTMKTVTSGNRTAINLAGVEHEDVSRGMLLAEKGALRNTQVFDAQIEVLPDAERPIRSRQRLRLHIGSAEVLARASVLNDVGELGPGRTGFVQFRLESPVVAIFGERFVVRRYSPQLTVAGGIVLDPFATRHRRKLLAEDIETLRGLVNATGNAEKLLLQIVRSGGIRGISLSEIRCRTGWKERVLQDIVAAARDKIIGAHGVLVSHGAFDTIRSEIVRRVLAFHKREPLMQGIGRETLRTSMSRAVDPLLVDAAINALVQARELAIVNDLLRSAVVEIKLSDEESRAKAKLLSIYESAGLEPPKLADALAGERTLDAAQTRRIFQILLDSGTVTKVSEEFYFASQALRDLRSRLSAFAAQEQSIDVSQFKELAKVSRKYAIPLLEYFDREKVTVRSGDKRIILK